MIDAYCQTYDNYLYFPYHNNKEIDPLANSKFNRGMNYANIISIKLIIIFNKEVNEDTIFLASKVVNRLRVGCDMNGNCCDYPQYKTENEENEYQEENEEKIEEIYEIDKEDLTVEI